MGKDHQTSSSSSCFSLRFSCQILAFFSCFSLFAFLYWSYFSVRCNNPLLIKTSLDHQIQNQNNQDQLNLLTYPRSWNLLNFTSHQPPPRLLKIALFVKKWPHKNRAGGLERHAMTLHRYLAERGHEVHIFTASSSSEIEGDDNNSNLRFHWSKPTAAGYLDQATVWKQFLSENSTDRHFDVVHTESVALMHTRARNLSNIAVSWHGIAYESIHSDIIQELILRAPEDDRRGANQSSLSSPSSQRVLQKVVEEVKFFPRYAHHVATSDHVGEVLKMIYMLPEERVHIILNGVDEDIFKPDPLLGNDFRLKLGVNRRSRLVIGMAGRLVKDKGHPLIFEALKQIFDEDPTFREGVFVLVAGDGPWGARYRDLGSDNMHVLGPLDRSRLAGFYNAIDVFVNPTLRAQGLDHTLLEAMLVGKPLMGTKLASITGSVIVGSEIGYTFSPNVEALKKALYEVWRDGRDVLKKKGLLGRERALKLFTATKMGLAYERLFLCIAEKQRRTDSNEFCSMYNS